MKASLKKYKVVYRSIVRLISVGVIAIILPNVLVGLLLFSTNTKRNSIVELQKTAAGLAHVLSNVVSESEAYLYDESARDSVPIVSDSQETKTQWLKRFQIYIDHVKLSEAGGKIDLTNISRSFNSLVTIIKENEDWKGQNIASLSDVYNSISLDNTRKQMAELMETVEIRIGQVRLHDALATPRTASVAESSSGKEAIELLDLLRAYKTELLETSQAIENIATTSSLDDLREIVANRLTPLIERSLQLLVSIAKVDPTYGDILRVKTTSLYAKVFGADFSYNAVQMELIQGKGGLIYLYTNFHTQRKMKELLEEKAALHLNSLRSEMKHIAEQTEEIASGAIIEIENEMHTYSKILVGTSLTILVFYFFSSLNSVKVLRAQSLKDSAQFLELTVANKQLRKTNQALTRTLTTARERELEDDIKVALRGEFFAEINREVRTPLAGILGMIKFIMSSDLPDSLTEEQRKGIKAVEISTTNVVGILNNLVDCALLDAHKLDIELVEFDLRATLEQVVGPLSSERPESDAPLMLSMREDVPSLLIGDPTKIGQVVHTLVHHALRYISKPGTVVIRVAKVSQTPKQVTLQFSVVNAISTQREEFLDILERGFVQEDSSVVRTFGSKGLALLTAGRILSLLGGHSWIESSNDTYVNVHFTLRVQKQRPKPEKVDSQAFSSHNQEEQQTINDLNRYHESDKPSVLLIECDGLYGELALQLLTQCGYKTIHAQDGESALPILAQERIDMILVNVQTPEVNGLATVQMIRSSEMGTDIHVPIVGLTGNASKDEREECFARGLDDYVTKPLTALGMNGIVERSLRNWSHN